MPAWKAEIEALHAFFEAWIGGTIPQTDDPFLPLEEALAETFTLTTTSGELMGREAIVGTLRESHGARPGLRIQIREPRLVRSCEHHVVATYEEWQETDGKRTGRASTVLLERRDGARNGLVWVHVHETWVERE